MGLSSGVGRTREGAVRVRLSTQERDVLRTLPAQLRPLLAGEDGPAAMHDRLFPRAYDDDEQEHEYRGLVADDLRSGRLAALDTFATDLEAGQTRRGTWSADLDEEGAGAWLSAMNDARLILGQILDIRTEHDWEAPPAGDDPAGALLYYLGWLQEEMLAALSEHL